MNVWYMLGLLVLLLATLFLVERVTRPVNPYIEAMELVTRVMIRLRLNTEQLHERFAQLAAAAEAFAARFPPDTDPEPVNRNGIW